MSSHPRAADLPARSVPLGGPSVGALGTCPASDPTDWLRCRGRKGLEDILPLVAAQIREAVLVARNARELCPEAIKCCGQLAQAVGPPWGPFAQELVEPMLCTGLSEVLVESLSTIARSIRPLLPLIQEQLLDMISLVLARRPYREPLGGYSATTADAGHSWGPNSRASLFAQTLQLLDAAGQVLAVRLALRTLGTFELGTHDLLEFVRYGATQSCACVQ